ncbi:MAG TPA: sce7726 family protein [Terriglobales bacterium]|nr:sce7726 family protein [Terriglobales bacterium]
MNPAVNCITEIQLRDALRAYLATSLSGAVTGRIVEELGVECGTARIDVALITDRLLGFEIKSDLDTFDRLSNQVHAYNRVFDEITLVTGPALLDEAVRLLPSWWGVMVAECRPEGRTELSVVRAAEKNPIQEALSIAMLLWKPEALDALADHIGRHVPARWASAKVHAALAEVVPLQSLQRLVATKLTARAAWRSPEQSIPDGDSSRPVATSIDCLA